MGNDGQYPEGYSLITNELLWQMVERFNEVDTKYGIGIQWGEPLTESQLDWEHMNQSVYQPTAYVAYAKDTQS